MDDESFHDVHRHGSRLQTICNLSNDVSVTEPRTNGSPPGYNRSRRRSDPESTLSTGSPGRGSCCIAGEHFFTSDQIDNYFTRTSSSSIGSAINVNISDITGEDNMIATTAALRRCKTKVLNPYNALITLIGWRQFRRGSPSCCMRILNNLYLLGIIILLLVGYTYQTFSCSGKLNVHTDTQIKPFTMRPSVNVTTTTQAPPVTKKKSLQSYIGGPAYDGHKLLNSSSQLHKKKHQHHNEDSKNDFIKECDHLVTTYILPALLHFAAFCYGVYYFRFQENEQLHSLMERVFLQAQATMGAQERLIRNCRIFLFGAAIWLILCLIQEVIFFVAFGHHAVLITFCKDDSLKTYLVNGVGILGTMIQQSINLAIILNYCTQCEMVILYTRGICLRLHEKSQELKAIMHEILGLREFVSLLNGALSRITALCIFVSCEMFIIGMCLLVLNQIQTAAVYSYRVMFFIIWLIAFLVPLVQASRLTKEGRHLSNISFEMKVFGYKNISQLEIDSFMLFVGNAKLRAKLFSIPISPGVAMGGTVLVCITLVLLFQTGVITARSFF